MPKLQQLSHRQALDMGCTANILALLIRSRMAEIIQDETMSGFDPQNVFHSSLFELFILRHLSFGQVKAPTEVSLQVFNERFLAVNESQPLLEKLPLEDRDNLECLLNSDDHHGFIVLAANSNEELHSFLVYKEEDVIYIFNPENNQHFAMSSLYFLPTAPFFTTAADDDFYFGSGARVLTTTVININFSHNFIAHAIKLFIKNFEKTKNLFFRHCDKYSPHINGEIILRYQNDNDIDLLQEYIHNSLVKSPEMSEDLVPVTLTDSDDELPIFGMFAPQTTDESVNEESKKYRNKFRHY